MTREQAIYLLWLYQGVTASITFARAKADGNPALKAFISDLLAVLAKHAPRVDGALKVIEETDILL